MNRTEVMNLIEETRRNFKNHEAVLLVDEDDIQVMDWKRPGSSIYAMRCVINRNHMTISGDVGTVVFNLTWHPTFTSKWDEEYSYLKSKIVAWSEESDTWSYDVAEKDIKDWYEQQVKEYSEDEHILKKIEAMREILDDCLSEVSYSSSVGSYWKFQFELEASDLSRYDHEWYETFERFGKTIPMRFYIWIEGLRLASKQLRGEL